MDPKKVTNINRSFVILAIAKGDAHKTLSLEKMDNAQLQQLLNNSEEFRNKSKEEKIPNPQLIKGKNFDLKLNKNIESKNLPNIFNNSIGNLNFDSMDGLVIERLSCAEPVQTSQKPKPEVEKDVNSAETMSDEELMKKWDSLPQYVKDLYQTYLNNLSEGERVEAEKGFLDKIRDFFTRSFKVTPFVADPSLMLADGDAWEKGVKEALTNDVSKKLKNDEKNIKQLANLSLNFDDNIESIKVILKDILGVDVSDEEIRQNKDKLIKIAELSANFDANLSEITQLFKEITGLDLFEEDLLKNKENIDKLNAKSEELESQYDALKGKYKEITGKDLSDEEFEKILNGEGEVDNEEFNRLLGEYLHGYEEFAEISSDVISGVASFGAFCGTTMVAGPFAGYAAAVGTGAGVKYGLKKANASNKSEGYNTAAQDLITGGVGGLFNSLAPTIGSAATKAIFNRGGKKLLEKVAMKSANKALPNFLNQAVAMDTKYLGASKVQQVAARYMQAAVEGTTAITPYNIAAELSATEENKQGWGNVAVNSVIGGLVFGPVMDLGFRAIGKSISKVAGEKGIHISPADSIKLGSPANAAAYKNITVLSADTFSVNVGGKNVEVKIPSSQLPADPAYIYAQACKQIGINTKEEMLKTLGLKNIELPKDPASIQNFLKNTANDNKTIISASDGKNNYSVKVNNDGTVTLQSIDGSNNNFSANQTTMSIEEFTQNYQIAAHARETFPDYLTEKSLDRMSDKSNVLVSREVDGTMSKEIVVDSINKENKTVTVKLTTSDELGNFKTETQELSYEDFIERYQKNQNNLDDVLNMIHDVSVKYGFEEKSIRENVVKGLDVNHPVFKNEKTLLAYINDCHSLAVMRNADNEPTFSFKFYNQKTDSVENYIDAPAIQEIISFKHSNPEFAPQIDNLLNALKNGEISPKELRNAVKALEGGYISADTMEAAINKGFVKDGKVNLSGFVDDDLPKGALLQNRQGSLSTIEKIIGNERFQELKRIMGDDITKIQWETMQGMKPDEIIKFVEDMKNVYILKQVEISPENFFIDIPGYGKNVEWAKSMVQTTDYAAMMIKEGKSLEEVLEMISTDTRQIDLGRDNIDQYQKLGSGILRHEVPGWRENGAYTPYGTGGGRYDSYSDRFDELLPGWGKELKNPYPDMELTRIGNVNGEKVMMHPKGKHAQAALKHVDDIYQELQQKFAGKKVTDADLPFINEKIAEIHWILAHSMPWGRGSDAIANSFVKSVYKSLNIETAPPAKGISFDLEAFCTDLAEYKKKYAGYYSRPPVVAPN